MKRWEIFIGIFIVIFSTTIVVFCCNVMFNSKYTTFWIQIWHGRMKHFTELVIWWSLYFKYDKEAWKHFINRNDDTHHCSLSLPYHMILSISLLYWTLTQLSNCCVKKCNQNLSNPSFHHFISIRHHHYCHCFFFLFLEQSRKH